MANVQPVRPRLQVEFLEAREVPDGSPITETFNGLAPPALPPGWGRWSNDGTAVFAAAAGQGVDGSVALVTSGGSRTSGLTWYGTQVDGDTGAAVSVKANSLTQSFVFTRGSNLDTSTPSYLAAVVTRGLKVELRQVTNGVMTVIGSVSSPNSAYLSGPWVRVTLVPTGNAVAVQVTRADTGQYLAANGRWQDSPTAAITATTTLAAANGFVGVGRSAIYSGAVNLDDFAVLPPTPTSVSQSFDSTAAGAVPTGWQTWVTANGTLGATATRALSPANGFASTGTSLTAARAWDTTEPARRCGCFGRGLPRQPHPGAGIRSRVEPGHGLRELLRRHGYPRGERESCEGRERCRNHACDHEVRFVPQQPVGTGALDC